jgi:hypothetical protein
MTSLRRPPRPRPCRSSGCESSQSFSPCRLYTEVPSTLSEEIRVLVSSVATERPSCIAMSALLNSKWNASVEGRFQGPNCTIEVHRILARGRAQQMKKPLTSWRTDESQIVLSDPSASPAASILARSLGPLRKHTRGIVHILDSLRMPELPLSTEAQLRKIKKRAPALCKRAGALKSLVLQRRPAPE